MTYDHLDAELVNSLLRDGRASFRSLADDLDVSVTTISNHLDDLEAEGVIEGYTIDVDYDALDFDVTAVLQLKVDGSALPDVTSRLAEHDQTISVYEVTGHFDIVAIGKFRDTDGMNAAIKELLGDGNVNESSTSVVLSAPTENRQLELPAG